MSFTITKYNIQVQTQQQTMETWADDLKRCFSKEETDGSQVREKMPNISIKEMQIQSTMTFQLMLLRVAISKKSTSKKRGCRCGEKSRHLHGQRVFTSAQPLQQIVWIFSENQKWNYHMIQHSRSWGYIQTKL